MPVRIANNPCQNCGACCALYRVSFYWAEADIDQGGTVPPDLTEPLPPYLTCMRGTNQPHARCAALRGRIGGPVACSIYALRSSTCREFGVHAENGQFAISPEDLERCNRARAAWGLPPLRLERFLRTPVLPATHVHRHRPPLR